MSGSIRLRRTPAGECVITPTGTDSPPPTVLADEPDVDVAVLEVAGGHLTWSVLADTPIACAVLDDVEAAQSWLWALYGERVAVVVDALAIEPLDPDERPEQELPIDPVHPDLVARAHRLAFAQWALRWWPASAIDDIPPLDRGLLEREITELIEECDQLFDGIDAAEAAGVADRPGEIDDLVDSEPGTARDYALAAGAGGTDNSGGSVLAGGNGGSDWRCYPPGLIDAAETAVSWELVRIAARTVVEVSVVAAPGLDAPDSSAMPTHLLPRATLHAEAAPVVDVDLQLLSDTWVGRASSTATPAKPLRVGITLPGFGAVEADRDPARARRTRERIRTLVRARLSRVHTAEHGDPALDATAPLLAELAAVEQDF
ncbi:hypothetical protein [Actinoalloteichus hymeniacidonis]|uniref:Uncharacterized protein n=1 Tax=Actinoalloteichus hymeniacidonis TaxID=340345 RepID=A0AAC9HQV4_9PSEU|nr:hypothetical protein [Actinoalloteichus hymeniacidonis]AOS63859.1 hypothetical protein TL08_15250 [Actinoalloteichus hymeniacidonis]MBB5908085.1 hypothetical protein [Actinoalloteichus hymeniacidonis]